MSRPTIACLLPALLLLATPGHAQEKPAKELHFQDHAPILVYHDPGTAVPDDLLINGLILSGAQERVRPILKAVCGDAVLLDESYAYVRQARNQEPAPAKQPAGVFSTELWLSLHGIDTLESGKTRQIYELVTAMLQEELHRRLVAPDEETLQLGMKTNEEQVQRLRKELLRHRVELARNQAAADPAAARALVADATRRLREVEMDLRVEQAMQQKRTDMIAEARTRLRTTGNARRDSYARQNALQEQLDGHKALIAEKATEAEVRREIDRITAEMRTLSTEIDDQHEVTNRSAAEVNDLAGQIPAATLRLHELATRRSLLSEEIDAAVRQAESAAQRSAALVELQQQVADTKAELEALREQRTDLKRRYSELRPVRVELWR